MADPDGAAPPPKKRKWDMAGDSGTTGAAGAHDTSAAAGPGGSGAGGQIIATDPVERARQVAAQLSAAAGQQRLAQTLAKLPIPQPAAAPQQQSGGVQAEVPINDAPAHIRINLLKKPVQAEVEKRTGTVIVVRGRFYSPGQAVDPNGEKPLHLYIKPGVHLLNQSEEAKAGALAAAVADINALLRGQPLPPAPLFPAPPPPAGGYPPPGAAPPTYAYYPPPGAPAPPAAPPPPPIMLYVAIANAPLDFNLPERIRGPGSSYLGHIQATTGATVQLRGRGSITMEGPDPLHLFIAAPTQKQITDAQGLSMDLLNTIKDELVKKHPEVAGGITASTVALAPGYAPPPAPVPPTYSAPPPQAPVPPPAAAPAYPPHAATPPYQGYPGAPAPGMYPPPAAPPTAAPMGQPPGCAAPSGAAPPPAGSYPPQAAPAGAPALPTHSHPYAPPAYAPPPGGASHPPPYYAHAPPPGQYPPPAYAPPPAPGAVQVPPPYYAQPAATQHAAGQPPQASSQQQQQQQAPQRTPSPPRRKFREFVEKPQQSALQNPYAGYVSGSAGSGAPSATSGPDTQQQAGPQPPSTAAPKSDAGLMPPPPLPQRKKTSDSGTGQEQGSALPGLADYGDD